MLGRRLSSVFANLREKWQAFRRLPPGGRFQLHYEEQQRAHAHEHGWLKALRVLLVPVLFVIGVVLLFIPGPAILFFFLAGALLATHSRWVARVLDRAELKLRRSLPAR